MTFSSMVLATVTGAVLANKTRKEKRAKRNAYKRMKENDERIIQNYYDSFTEKDIAWG